MSQKERILEIVARTGQPQVVVKVPQIERKSYDMNHVSSSWIGELGYNEEAGEATMRTLDGNEYGYGIDFQTFEAWYYAMSKGTFWHKNIAGKFPSTKGQLTSQDVADLLGEIKHKGDIEKAVKGIVSGKLKIPNIIRRPGILSLPNTKALGKHKSKGFGIYQGKRVRIEHRRNKK